MSEPHTPRRKLKTPASRPATSSPYFHSGRKPTHIDSNRSQCDSNVSFSDNTMVSESRQCLNGTASTLGISELKTSSHFSSRASSSTGALKPCQTQVATPKSLQDSDRCIYESDLDTHRSLSRNAAYCNFYDTFMRSFNRLFRAKPILIQGMRACTYVSGVSHSHAAQSMWPTTPGSC